MSKHSEASRAVDAVVVAALTGMLLLNFESTFVDRDYLLGAVAGMLAIGAIVLVADYYDKGVGVMLLCGLPTYVLVGATVGIRTTDSFFQVPTPQAMASTLSATVSAGNQLLTTIPPVDTVGDATLVPYALAFLTGGIALVAALRTERPLGPVVPLVVGLAASILLGTQERTLLQVQAVVFAATCLWWTAQRAARRGRVVHDGRGRVVRLASTIVYVVCLAAAVTLVLPSGDDDSDRVVLRGRIGAGADVTSVTTPLSTFRTFTRQPSTTSSNNVFKKRLLRVDGLPRGVPVRFAALDAYDGVTWYADNGTVSDAQDDAFLRIGSEVAARWRGRPVKAEVHVTRNYRSDWLPLPGQLTGVSFVYRDGRAQLADVRYNPATTTAVVLGGLDARDDYEVEAAVEPLALGKHADGFPTSGPLQPEGAFLDEALKPWRDSGMSPMAQVRSLAYYLLTNGRYSDGASADEVGYTAGHDAQRLGQDFFFAPRIVGDDEQYAAFLALAANRLGVPARVVVGAVPGRGGWVKGRDVEAWVELRVITGAWRALTPSAYMSRKPPRSNDGPRQLPTDFLNPEQPSEVPSTKPPRPPRSEDDQDAAGPAGAEGQGPGGLLWGLLLALLAAAVPLSKLVRRQARATLGTPEARIVGGWREVLDQARDLGRPVPAWLGRVDQARLLELDPGPARRAQDVLFARSSPESAASSAFWRVVREQRRALARRAGPLRRAWALWNPASLLLTRVRSTQPRVSPDVPRPEPAGRRARRRSARRGEPEQ